MFAGMTIESDNDDLFSFTCPVDNVKLDCDIVSFCPLTREDKAPLLLLIN